MATDAVTYEDGEALGCPDCACGEPHCCPFLYADNLPEPRRSRVLDHMRRALSDVDEEVGALWTRAALHRAVPSTDAQPKRSRSTDD